MITSFCRPAALVVAALLMFGTASAAEVQGKSSEDVAAQTLYWQGHEALAAGDWDQALTRFADLEQHLHRKNSASADAAVYWQAYALTHAKRFGDARETIARLQRDFPQSRWSDDAAALTRAAARSLPQRISAGDEAAEAALEGVLKAPNERAVALLMQVIEGDYSMQIKRRALFVLSQIEDTSSLTHLAALAKGSDEQLSDQAIQMLGVSGATTQLREVYTATADENKQRKVLRALGVADATEALAQIARGNAALKVRREAIRNLGVAGGVDALVQVAQSDADLELRREAIRSLGVAGATEPLIKLYGQSPQLRDEAVAALRISSDSKALLDLYERARTAEEKQALMRIYEEMSDDTSGQR